jgi:hypothetical protein
VMKTLQALLRISRAVNCDLNEIGSSFKGKTVRIVTFFAGVGLESTTAKEIYAH